VILLVQLKVTWIVRTPDGYQVPTGEVRVLIKNGLRGLKGLFDRLIVSSFDRLID
jgi:hypothetical protein